MPRLVRFRAAPLLLLGLVLLIPWLRNRQWFTWSELGLALLVALFLAALREFRALRILVSIVAAPAALLGAWLLVPDWTTGWELALVLLIGLLLLVAARRFGAIWIFCCLVAAAAIAWWGIQGAQNDSFFKLITAGMALPVLVVYCFFKWTAPLAPQRQAEVYVDDGATESLSPKPAAAHAERFRPYAVLSEASYRDRGPAQRYVLAEEPSWQLVHEKAPSSGRWLRTPQTESDSVKGLHYQVWFRKPKKKKHKATFAVAFRGTRFTRPSDWNANLHWLLGFRDHYTDIEDFIARCISDCIEVLAKAKGLSGYRLVCTGHSLGGGLARQLAFCYPGQGCTNVKVYGFDSSAVDGRLWLKNRPRLKENRDKKQLTISEVYERGEVLSVLRWGLSLLARSRFLEDLRNKTTYYRFNYSVSANVIQSHDMEELATALKAIAGAPEPADVKPRAARLQLRLIYDYIKFHIAMYMATPVLLMVFAHGFQVKEEEPFLVGLVIMVLIFAIAGMHASAFMGAHVNRQWQTDYLEEFERRAFSTRRRFMHHWMYWAGLLAGIAGFVLSVVYRDPQP